MDLLNTPAGEHLGQHGAGNEGAFEAVVERGDILSANLVGYRNGERAEIFGDGAKVGFRKVGVVKADHGNIQAAPRGDGFPGDLVGVTGLDDVWEFLFQNLLDEVEFGECPVAGGEGEERGGNRVGANEVVAEGFRFFSRNDDDVSAVRPVLSQIRALLLNIAPHSTAHGGVELREIADLERSLLG